MQFFMFVIYMKMCYLVWGAETVERLWKKRGCVCRESGSQREGKEWHATKGNVINNFLVFSQGNLKGEPVMAAILMSRMEVNYCTSKFFHS